MSEITYVTLRADLCEPIEELLKICFPDMPPEDQYDAEMLLELEKMFAEGTIVALDQNRVVGMGTGIFVSIDFDNLTTEHNLFVENDHHNPEGIYYYGSDMAVHPDYRGRGIARQIYNRRKDIVIKTNRKGFVAAATLPGFANHKHEITSHAYVDKVVAGEIFDPTLSVQLRNGFKLMRVLQNFYIYPKSDNWSALIMWENPEYKTDGV